MRTLGLALLSTLVLAAPASAAFPDNSAMLFSSSGEPLTQGIPHAFTDSNATFTVFGGAGDVTVEVVGNGPSLPDSGDFQLEFAAKPGTALKPGTYKNVEMLPGRSANRAGMAIRSFANGSTSCSSITGWFEVEDIATDTSGAVNRLQVLYELHCNGGEPAVWGEVRVGEPAAGAAAVVTPSQLILPDTAAGEPTNRGAVALLVATSSLSITGVSFSGRDAGDFSQSTVSCSGTCPNPNGPFTFGDTAGVGVTFTPQKVGTRLATLTISDSTGATYAVPVRASTSR